MEAVDTGPTFLLPTPWTSGKQKFPINQLQIKGYGTTRGHGSRDGR